MAYDKEDLEQLSIKYFGTNHSKLTPEEKFDILMPLDSELSKKARDNYRAMSSEQISEALYHSLLAAEALPEVIAALQSARAKAEKGKP